ncbi:MFS transporter [Bradyrhizobium erythrophlei]|jgi:DHA1 family inner membrane transport protein|uniref:Predicted arabinose efflux permease, MFS family n=1 Tax=Bradyrhizobium erythrophlei TaxID=1437360 RepID=A0A1M5NQF6_9BRAD|nr:MFS transporter [Bradyrhizobium erythrophlei]SHG91762.1 Predicted arabinose efflux permease, MFS family [Bradyrhizobium erythrophlei]
MMTNEAVSPPMVESDARPSSTRQAVGLVLLLGVSYMFNAMDRQVFPALLGSIRADYGLTLPEAGFVSTVFTVNVAIFAALSGWFMARFGRRYVLLGGLVCYSLFTLLTPLATGFVNLTVLRALTGVGEALQVGAVFACMGAYFGERRGAAMGAMQTFFGLGAFLGPVLGTRLESWAGSWSASFYAYGVAGIAMAIVAAVVIPLEFTDAGVAPSLARNAEMPTASIWTRNLILSAVSFGFVGFSFFSYSALYASYAHTVLGFSVVDAGAALGMYGIGAMLGVFGGWLGDKISNRSIIGGLLLMATAGYVLFDGVPQFRLHLLLSLVFGLTMSGFLFTRFMSVVQRSVDPSQIGYAGAVALAAFYLPGPFAGWLFGKLVETAGWSTASLLVVVAPPLLGVVLMSLYDFSKMRKD